MGLAFFWVIPLAYRTTKFFVHLFVISLAFLFFGTSLLIGKQNILWTFSVEPHCSVFMTLVLDVVKHVCNF